MPGIAGIVFAGPDETRETMLQAMLKCMKHEPFYNSGTLVEKALSLGVLWVCQGGCFSDCLPIWNERKDICLIFSGKPFADPADLARTRKKGCECSPDDARSLVQLYEELGNSFFERLNGVFSGVVVDLRERKAVLFNDRYGLQRIYHHQNNEGFYFASEAKSLLKALPETRRLDERGFAEWLSCGSVLQNRSLFCGISLLPPGSAWTFAADGKIEKRRYFNPAAWETQPKLSPDEFDEHLKETFPRILRRYLVGKEPLAMSLTGGLDGRMIMAWSQRGPGELTCYTFNGSFRDCADVKIARKVAQACGQSHQTIPVGDQFLAEFPTLAEKAVYVTDGAMDVTGAVELYVNRMAREIAPVRLTGNYGSEILRGNIAFKPRKLSEELFSPDLLQQTRAVARTYSEEAAGNRLSFIAFKQVPWHHFARFAIEQSQVNIRSPFLDNEFVALAFQAPPETAMSMGPSLRLIADGNPQLARIPTDRGVTYPGGRAANRINRSIQEFLAKAEYAYDYGMPSWLARIDKCLAPLRLERLFLGRQKFCHFRTWYRHQLAGYASQILLDPRALARPYVSRGKIEKILAAHLAGDGNYTTEIHKLLSSELLQQQLLEKS